MDWLYKALLTATTVALLLTVAQLWGRRLAGVLTGLPTITAPALLWLAHAQGSERAFQAGRGALASGAVCAVFALAYAVASRRVGPARSLLASVSAGLLPAAVFWQWRPALPAVFVAVMLVCAACAVCAARVAHHPVRPVDGLPRRALGHAPGVALQAAVSGTISGVVSAWGNEMGAYAAGALSSLPIVAAAIAVWLHAFGGRGSIAPFLHGYLAGLQGRTIFVAVFCAVLVPLGAGPALAMAAAALAACLSLSGRPLPIGSARARGKSTRPWETSPDGSRKREEATASH